MMAARARPEPSGTRSNRAADPLGWVAALSIGVLVLFNVALISLAVGSIPIRAILAVALLGLFGLLRPEALRAAAARHALIILLAGLLAALGLFSSIVNGGSLAVVFRAILEVHVQAVVIVLLASVAAHLSGTRAVITAFVAAIGVSAAIGLLQFAGLDAAWAMREVLGRLQGHDLGVDSSFYNRRPMGLSYSPIHLATQACLAFAAYAGFRYRETIAAKLLDWRIGLAIALLVAVSFASATRSPILGAMVFVAVYLLQRGNIWMVLLLLTGGIALYVAAPTILDAMQGAEHRALRVGDNSATGRLPLFTFGFKLFLANPLGYGFDFVAHDYWTEHWAELYMLPSADVVRDTELHNYFLNMLTTYGIGLLLVLPLAAVLLWRARAMLPVFVPYLVHIVFHNSGPFWNDALIWFVIGALSVAQSDGRTAERSGAKLRIYRPPPTFRPRAEV